MLTIREKMKDGFWRSGLLILCIQLVLFCLPYKSTDFNYLGIFVINWLLSLTFFIITLFGGLRKKQSGLHLFLLFLVCCLLAAYSLNREITLFDESATWLSVLLVIVCINYIVLPFFENWPLWGRYVQCFVLGMALVLFLYMSLYLLPMYLFSAVAAIALGISLHTFVPLLLVIYTIKLQRRLAAVKPGYLLAMLTGAGSALIVMIVFVILWCVQVNHINGQCKEALQQDVANKPDWVQVARTLPQNMVTERILKSGLVYRQPDDRLFSLWNTPANRFDERRQHDPLVVTGQFFSNTIQLPEEDRIKVLKFMYNARHKAVERLWSGESLATTRVQTQVNIWPQLYLSYTALHVTVANQVQQQRWSNQEEAIYSFQLPEGGVVTSLSLWINGVESKGMLTTRAKADSAYTTIVGRERRDPSVVHWQEGNKVVIRVFPVLAGESREFAIGVTAPFTNQGTTSQYQSIYFEGPSCESTEETVTVKFQQPVNHASLPGGFTAAITQPFCYTRKGKYRPEWNITFDKQPLAPTSFVFAGKSYALQPMKQERATATVQTVFLDVNREWTRKEWNKVYDAVQLKKVYVAGENDSLILVTNDNQAALFRQLSTCRFSCFPFYTISHPEEALVITKGTHISPSLHDMAGSGFMQQLQAWFAHGKRIKLFNIGSQLSPYLQSLKQFQAFEYEQGDVLQLCQLLIERKFAINEATAQKVVLAQAGMAITQVDSSCQTPPGKAPDHLMRLFAYNHIMQQAGPALLQQQEVPQEVIDEAEQAYVVSPASSLVVLETQADYDRFDIKASKNSLQNATIDSKGAVPEPGTWVLIIVVLLLLVFTKYRFYKKAIQL